MKAAAEKTPAAEEVEQHDRVGVQELSGLQEGAAVQAEVEGLAAAAVGDDHVIFSKVEHTDRPHPLVPHSLGEWAESVAALEVLMEVPMEVVDDLAAVEVQLEALEVGRLVGMKEYTCTDRNPHHPARHESVGEQEVTVALLAALPSMS